METGNRQETNHQTFLQINTSLRKNKKYLYLEREFDNPLYEVHSFGGKVCCLKFYSMAELALSLGYVL